MAEEKNSFENLVIHPIARIHTDFPQKFGIPRQAALAEHLEGRIVLEPAYRKPGVFKGLEQFSHLWLIWGFSMDPADKWTPTVRPPRLGGNKRVGVFACRSPFRPNPLGLSAVRLLRIEENDKDGEVLVIGGSDLMDGTPIYDIKPYVPYSDALSDASEGFAKRDTMKHLEVVIPENLKRKIPAEKYEGLVEALSFDPRPQYQHDPNRVYGFAFANLEIQFKVEEDKKLVVTDIHPIDK